MLGTYYVVELLLSEVKIYATVVRQAGEDAE